MHRKSLTVNKELQRIYIRLQNAEKSQQLTWVNYFMFYSLKILFSFVFFSFGWWWQRSWGRISWEKFVEGDGEVLRESDERKAHAMKLCMIPSWCLFSQNYNKIIEHHRNESPLLRSLLLPPPTTCMHPWMDRKRCHGLLGRTWVS